MAQVYLKDNPASRSTTSVYVLIDLLSTPVTHPPCRIKSFFSKLMPITKILSSELIKKKKNRINAEKTLNFRKRGVNNQWRN